MDIPVFHDDQHGTAIVTAAGMINALELQDKKIDEAKVVCLGAGAAAIACMKLLISCGVRSENIYMLDRKGVIHSGREDLNQYKAMFANDTDKRTLDDAMDGADVFLGLSGPDLLSADQLKLMAPNPIVFACSNPDPEISPEVALATRDDLIMATGRSDYPNQVNNVLGFPFIFRGALDVRATAINASWRKSRFRRKSVKPMTLQVSSLVGSTSFPSRWTCACWKLFRRQSLARRSTQALPVTATRPITH